jgi:hypothetical protein
MKMTNCFLVVFVSASAAFGFPIAQPQQAATAGSSLDRLTRGAVTTEVISTLGTTLNRMNTHTATAADFASSATALKILFAQWEENGTNAKLQALITSEKTALLNFAETGPTAEQVTEQYVALTSAGMTVTQEQVRNNLTISLTQMKQFLTQYGVAGGVEKVEAQTVQLFNVVATTVQPLGAVGTVSASLRS